MNKEVVLTGVRANNDLHIGNYFGAIKPIIDMVGKYKVNLFIPDLHSFTTPIDHKKLQDSIMNTLRVYAAAGLPLDDDSVLLYRQSYVPAHSELAVILNNFAGFGELSRMTQFKDKSNDHVSVGLFDYPVLMASDILLYNARYIPVGDDQAQHLELTRDIAGRMNRKFGEVFTMPEPVLGKLLRIKDLQDPSKKMSKSDETGKGVIFLTDTPDVARKKIMSTVTDSLGKVHYDKYLQPGIANLLDIMMELRGTSILNEFNGMESYGKFKNIVADEVGKFLEDFQAKLARVNDEEVLNKLEPSEREANRIANKTLLKVQKAVGLR